MNGDGTGQTRLFEGDLVSFDVADGRIYYSTGIRYYVENEQIRADYSTVALHSMRLDGSDNRVVYRSPVANINRYFDITVAGNRIYFRLEHIIDDRIFSAGLHSVRIDGSDFRRLQAQSESYASAFSSWAAEGDLGGGARIIDDLAAANGQSVIIAATEDYIEVGNILGGLWIGNAAGLIGLPENGISISFSNSGNDTDAVIFVNGIMQRIINIPTTGFGEYMLIDIDLPALTHGRLNTVRVAGTGGEFRVDWIGGASMVPRTAEARNFEEKVINMLEGRDRQRIEAYYILDDNGNFYIFDPNASRRDIRIIEEIIAKTDYTIEDLLRDMELAGIRR
jgi:hypothetical protein